MRPDIKSAIVITAVLAVVCCSATADISGLDDMSFQDLQYRDTQKQQKPVRDDGLGSLLLKNLRFRDLLRRSLDDRPVDMFYPGEVNEGELTGNAANLVKGLRNKAAKRGVSVSQLAELLHSLKSRGVEDDGVKLQSLRFGKR